MRQKVFVSVAFILLLAAFITTVCLGNEIVRGVTRTFNPETGKLVLQTSCGEAVVHLPQAVQIYVKPRLREEQVSETWDFLRNNLFEGTKVSIVLVDRQVTSILVLEVPQ